MSLLRKLRQKRQRRTQRVRSASAGSSLLRIAVFRSNRHLYAQLIDDSKAVTLASCSTLQVKDLQGDKKTKSHAIGKELARRAQEKGVNKVRFDRGRFLYHGRVKEVAEGLREAGLEV